MIVGSIHDREAIFDLVVLGLGPQSHRSAAVLDTGFNGYLTLPSEIVTKLRLQFVGHRRGTLADGSITRLKVYLGNLVWHARTKDVLILQAEGKPLIGMSLLEGNHLAMDVAEGGKATIDELA